MNNESSDDPITVDMGSDAPRRRFKVIQGGQSPSYTPQPIEPYMMPPQPTETNSFLGLAILTGLMSIGLISYLYW